MDTFGALALAVGVPEGSLSGDLIEMASAAPARRQVLLPICVELIESWTEEDLSAWNDRQETTAGSVASSLMRLAGLIEAVL